MTIPCGSSVRLRLTFNLLAAEKWMKSALRPADNELCPCDAQKGFQSGFHQSHADRGAHLAQIQWTNAFVMSAWTLYWKREWEVIMNVVISSREYRCRFCILIIVFDIYLSWFCFMDFVLAGIMEVIVITSEGFFYSFVLRMGKTIFLSLWSSL